MVLNVAYLGPAGTYTHQAALQEFGTDSNLIPQKSIASCFQAIESKSVDYAVVPLENSTNGQVVFTFDLFRDWFIPSNISSTLPSPPVSEDSANVESSENTSSKPDFRIVGEQFVDIHHCLLTDSKGLESITKIYSHPQVWGQVTRFLSTHFPNVERIDTSSTSKAAEIAKKEGPSVAAISASTASSVHNLPILRDSIEDSQTNSTRFLILGREAHNAYSSDHSDFHITSVAFTVKHDDSGALCNVLDCLKRYGLNLTSITSRPSHLNSWQYVFFIESWGSLNDENTKKCISDLKQKCSNSVVLGSFPRSKKYWGSNSD